MRVGRLLQVLLGAILANPVPIQKRYDFGDTYLC
jgi:hypothetical protein